MAAESFFNRINRLPDTLVDRIAAGEVIERPASVVKELIENSLDAGATRISVEIKRGGKQLIRVTDNGYGIHADDLRLAIDRHTTSKLDQDSDLSRIATLGFRGEALSSIAAVSRLGLTSGYTGSDHAWTLEADGHDSKLVPAAHPRGTTVRVGDLFYNTPARRKFLRSDRTEFIHIQDLVKRIALGRFQLAIELIHNGRKILQTRDDSSDPARRLQLAFGRKFYGNSVVLNECTSRMEIQGWAGLPEVSRSQSDQQFFYLNGRIIRDKLVNNAIRLAYQQHLYPGRYPVFLVFLEMDLSEYDVNVHPCKHEVRFRDTRSVHDFIYGTLSKALTEKTIRNGEITPPVTTNRERRYPSRQAGIHEEYREYGIHPQVYTVLQGKLVILDEEERVTLLDIHRAREMIAGRTLLNALDEGNIVARPVLVPLMYRCRENESVLFENCRDDLLRVGIETLPVAPAEYQIRSIPDVLAYADILPMVTDFLDKIKKDNRNTGVRGCISTLAHHASDLAPACPSRPEVLSLLNRIRKIFPSLTVKDRTGIMVSLDTEQMKALLKHG